MDMTTLAETSWEFYYYCLENSLKQVTQGFENMIGCQVYNNIFFYFDLNFLRNLVELKLDVFKMMPVLIINVLEVIEKKYYLFTSQKRNSFGLWSQ